MIYAEKKKNESPFVSVDSLIQPRKDNKGLDSFSSSVRVQPAQDTPRSIDPMENLAGIGGKTEKIKANYMLGDNSGPELVKGPKGKDEIKDKKESPTLTASKQDNSEFEIKRLLTIDIPYTDEGYDYSWLEKKKENLINSGTIELMTSGLEGGSLISDFFVALGWDMLDSLNEQDISPSKKKLINQAIYEWDIRINNNDILLMDFTMNASEISRLDKALSNSASIFTECVIDTVLGAIDKGLCGGLPVTSSLLSPELPRYKEGDAMLKMIALYKYKDSATKNSTLSFGSFGQGWSLLDKLIGYKPREIIDNLYVMTLEMQLRNSMIIDATWTLTEYSYYQRNREFIRLRRVEIP